MSNLLFNIRLGCYHVQIERDSWLPKFHKNSFWKDGKWREDWFCVYVLFGKHL